MNIKSVWIIDNSAPEGVRECWIEKIEKMECHGGIQDQRREGEIARQGFTLAYQDGLNTITIHRYNSTWLEYVNKCCTRVIHNNQVFSSKEEALNELRSFKYA